jgi:hypothetical protein
MTAKSQGNLSVREAKAAALDESVKAELTKKRAAEASKMTRLRELRLAFEAEEIKKTEAAPPTRTKPRLTVRRG